MATQTVPALPVEPPVGQTPAVTPTPIIFTYVVQPGDSLNAIAAHFGTSAHIIADFNYLSDPSVIRPGQILLIPQTEPGTPLPTAQPGIATATLRPANTPTPAPTSTPQGTLTPTPVTTPTATATPKPTSTSAVSLVGKIKLKDDCSLTNWSIDASGDDYYLLMPDDLTLTFDPEKESYPAMVSGLKDRACDGKLVIVETLTWLTTPTPTPTATTTPTATATYTPAPTVTATATATSAVIEPTAISATATKTTQNATATAAAIATATAQAVPGADATATAAAALTATATAASK